MSVTVVVKVSTVPGVSYPAGTVLGGYSAAIRLADASASPIVLTSPDLSDAFKFPDIAAGDYLAAVTRLDSSGSPTGAPVTVGPFTVPDSITPPPQEVIGEGPGTITVTFE